MSPDELEWLNEYNEEVRRKVGPLLEGVDEEAREWLEKETRALVR